MEEIWKDIPGYEGIYQVSNTGLVKTLLRTVYFNAACRQQPQKIMVPEKTGKGYLRIRLSKNGPRERVMVHRIVYEVFAGKIPNDLIINHKDRNKHNNHIDNLELVTHRRNTHHYRESTKRTLPIGVRKLRKKFQARLNISSRVIYLGVYATPEEASRVFQTAISNLNHAEV